jgi:tetratricopeptide (TPR) repeat protein
LLKKAELFTENNERLRAITYNNYACLFRKTNKLRNALSYLEQALDLEYTCLNTSDFSPVEDSLKISNPCEIHLNICAILSQMGKHELALHHAMKALLLIQDELIARTGEDSQGERPVDPNTGAPIPNPNDDRFTVMVIALHNIAVEHEYLK